MGYFHPRNTVADVYVWIASAMHAFATQSFTDIENSAQQAFEHFELYTSPPRTVLPPFQSMPKKTKRSPSLEDSSFLIDLNLVPAAVIHLSWKSAMVHRNAETGGYLRDDLVAVAFQQGAYAGSSKSIPQGVPLVEKATDKKASESEEQIMSSLDGKIESKADEKASSKVSKPKWFKL